MGTVPGCDGTGMEEEGELGAGPPRLSHRSTGGQHCAAATSRIDFLLVVQGGQQRHCTMNM